MDAQQRFAALSRFRRNVERRGLPSSLALTRVPWPKWTPRADVAASLAAVHALRIEAMSTERRWYRAELLAAAENRIRRVRYHLPQARPLP